MTRNQTARSTEPAGTARAVTRDAMQVFGGAGFLMDSAVQRYYRDAPVLTVGAGTSQIQRQIIAGQLGL